MNYILFDDISWKNLLPLTFTKPVCELRIGILTIKEKWENYLSNNISYLTPDYLQQKFQLKTENENIIINGSVIPNNELVNEINGLKTGQVLIKNEIVIATKLNKNDAEKFKSENIQALTIKNTNTDFLKLNFPWEIFKNNGIEIENDFNLITKGGKSASVSQTNQILGKGNIFIEEGAKLECTTLNTTTGPIYIGKNAEIMEGAVIRGPFALCDESVVKLAAKIYGPTTIGPHSKVGGEINNSVIQGYSNKAHDGFLGNSVIGEWCNLGADTNNSNLKNNYAEVKIWNYPQNKFIKTGLQFCGLIMGDHSKCGINTMFNTGTVVGINANIFGSGFPRNFIPSFAWGGAHGFEEYKLKTAFEVNEKVMGRRNIPFDEIEKNILEAVYNMTKNYRNF